MPDFKKERKEKSEVDYFAAFMTLWLWYNSRYKSHYSEIIWIIDRMFLDKIKTDFSWRNQTYSNFKTLIESEDRKGIEFKTNLELLIISLTRSNLNMTKTEILYKKISFDKALIDYTNHARESWYVNLIKSNSRSKKRNKIRLNDIELIENKEQIFAWLMEFIYQIRCLLFHWQMEPIDDNKNVVKYAYFLLYQLME